MEFKYYCTLKIDEIETMSLPIRGTKLLESMKR